MKILLINISWNNLVSYIFSHGLVFFNSVIGFYYYNIDVSLGVLMKMYF